MTQSGRYFEYGGRGRGMSVWWEEPGVRARAVRGTVKHIRYLARSIRDGNRMPAQALQDIVGCANLWRPRTPKGEPVAWEDVPYWPVYRPFYEIALRWENARKRGELSAELTDDLQVEMYEAALGLLGPRGGPDGERETRKMATVGVYYEGGRPLPEPRFVKRYR